MDDTSSGMIEEVREGGMRVRVFRPHEAVEAGVHELGELGLKFEDLTLLDRIDLANTPRESFRPDLHQCRVGGCAIHLTSRQREASLAQCGAVLCRAHRKSVLPDVGVCPAPSAEVAVEGIAEASPRPPGAPAMPPRGAKFLLATFLSRERQEDEVGDLCELFERRLEEYGPRPARFWFWVQTVRSLCPHLGASVGSWLRQVLADIASDWLHRLGS